MKLLNPLLGRVDSGFESLRRTYPRLLAWSLDHKGSVLALTLALVVGSAGLAQFLGAELIPSLVQGKFSFEIELPQGKPLEETDRIVREVESRVLDLDGVATVFSSVEEGPMNSSRRARSKSNRGWIHVSMKDGRDKAGEERVIGRTRSLLGQYPGLTHLFGRPTLFSFREPVEVEIYSYDLAAQRSIAEQVMGRLSGIEGVADVQSSTRLGTRGPGQFSAGAIGPSGPGRGSGGRDREKQDPRRRRLPLPGPGAAARYPGPGGRIGSGRHSGYSRPCHQYPAESHRSRWKWEWRPGWLPSRAFGERSGEGGMGSGSNAGRTEVDSETGEENSQVPIRLGSVARVQLARGPGEIRRVGSQRAAVVSANLAGADLGTVAQEIEAQLSGMSRELPPDSVVTLGGQHREYDRSRSSLLFALALAVLLVYLVMASQFESLVHPFVILFTVPVAWWGWWPLFS